MLNILWVAAIIGIGFIIEALFRRYLLARYLTAVPNIDGDNISFGDKLVGVIAQLLPNMLGLIFFFGASYFTYAVFFWVDSPFVELFFLATLIAIASIRTIAILAEMVFSPQHANLRIVPMQDHPARVSYRLIVWTMAYIVIVLMLAVVSQRLGAEQVTVRLMQLFFATLLILITAFVIISDRTKVRDLIIEAGEQDSQSLTWGRKQFAAVWHILALIYLGILWLLLVADLADPSVRGGGAFILSFFVVPIWMVADRLMQWVVKYSLSTLSIHQEVYDDKTEPTEEDLIVREKGRITFLRVKAVARIGVIGAFVVWVAELWNIRIPFFSNLAGVLLDSIIILTIALFFWRFISSWIERKIQESIPEGEEEEEDDQDEWGGAATRGRSYTLLPMLRKFIGTILAVMVIMTLLSSMGVDIGPLLAGAGVIGLAIGFGAQKLVADVFSGFFYLLDDAFRVGEYLQAGAVSGTVENITLRNIMLRHHRGMLQIIPHSELGAITNFMRGGIVVKFNLDFPYDAPIDKIRKIIKKTGQKMLESEQYGQDFIRPLKSQGVREITNSVMTIRAKFTAQPGTHFVIRREAYRLITEALNAQGIHYAHRKVIVDLPEEAKAASEDDGQKQLPQAAAAAAMRVIEEEEQAVEQGKANKDDEMMGG